MTRVILGTQELAEMRAELVVAIVLVSLDGSVLNCAVHALDLTVCSRIVWLGQAMFNAIWRTDHVKPYEP